MKLLFVIVGFLAVSVELASAGKRKRGSFDFHSFFKLKTTKTTTTRIPVTTKATTEPPRAPHEKKELPLHILSKLQKARSEAEFRKMIGLPQVQKKDEISGKVVKALGQSADGASPDVDDSWQSGLCIPRPVVVNLHETRYNLVIPRCVLVKRCGGCCTLSTDLQQCVAVETKTYKLTGLFYSHAGSLAMSSNAEPVRRRRRSNSYYTSLIPVEAHTRCECQCVKSQSDCSNRQEWKQDRCQCECLRQYSENELQCRYPIKFNRNTCKCECVLPPNNNCDLGKEWSHEACKCVCKKKNCKNPEVLNPSTCKCESS